MNNVICYVPGDDESVSPSSDSSLSGRSLEGVLFVSTPKPKVGAKLIFVLLWRSNRNYIFFPARENKMQLIRSESVFLEIILRSS